MSTLGEIRKVITPDNAAEILPRFFHCSAREAKEISAAIAPDAAPARKDFITNIRAVRRTFSTRAEPAPIGVVQTSEPAANTSPPARAETDVPLLQHSGASAALRILAPLPPPEEVRPLTAELRRLHVTVTKQWVEKLEAAKAALSHSIPSGSSEMVLEAALDALLEREAKRKGLAVNRELGRVARPEQPGRVQEAPAPAASAQRTESAPVRGSPSQHRKAIPAHVRREVLQRDQRRCQAKLHDGRICGSTVRLELDHIQPIALGGPSTVENLRLLCARHNQLAARAVFGEAWMDSFRTRSP